MCVCMLSLRLIAYFSLDVLFLSAPPPPPPNDLKYIYVTLMFYRVHIAAKRISPRGKQSDIVISVFPVINSNYLSPVLLKQNGTFVRNGDSDFGW